MGRLVVLLFTALILTASAGCSQMRDCEDACFEMRSCDYLYGTAKETCEVRCKANDDAMESEIDLCASCVATDCDRSCLSECVCALSLDTADYPGVSCAP